MLTDDLYVPILVPASLGKGLGPCDYFWPMDCGFQVKNGERNILSPSLSSLALVIDIFF